MSILQVVPKTKQEAARLKRLSEGRCPVHGIDTVYTGETYFANGEQVDCECPHCAYHVEMTAFVIMECPRRDCGIRLKLFDGMLERLPEVIESPSRSVAV